MKCTAGLCGNVPFQESLYSVCLLSKCADTGNCTSFLDSRKHDTVLHVVSATQERPVEKGAHYFNQNILS